MLIDIVILNEWVAFCYEFIWTYVSDKERCCMIESIRRNKKGILLMIISSMCVCIGQLLWKLSVDYGIMLMLLGFCFYGVGALIMIVAYRYGKLSVLQPMLSLNYVLSIGLAVIVLKEELHLLKCIGVLVIIMGVILIAGGDKE